MIEATRIQAVYRGYASRRITKMAIHQFEHDCLEIQQEIEYDCPSYHYQPKIGLAPYLGYEILQRYHHLNTPSLPFSCFIPILTALSQCFLNTAWISTVMSSCFL